MAAGAAVVSLCSTSDETIEEVVTFPAQPLLRLSKAATASRQNRWNCLTRLDLVVGETTCDGKKKNV